jgi:hypothetical protein
MGAGSFMYNATNPYFSHWLIEASGVATVGLALWSFGFALLPYRGFRLGGLR